MFLLQEVLLDFGKTKIHIHSNINIITFNLKIMLTYFVMYDALLFIFFAIFCVFFLCRELPQEKELPHKPLVRFYQGLRIFKIYKNGWKNRKKNV